MPLTVTITDPTGATEHDVTTLAGCHVLGDSMGQLEQAVEQDTAQETCGDISVTLANDPITGHTAGLWTDLWTDLDPEAVYDEATDTGTWVLKLKQGATVVWEGDIDPWGVRFDHVAKTVSATFFGKLKRLDHYNAALVVRNIPNSFDAFTDWADAAGKFRVTLANAYAVNALANHIFVDHNNVVFTVTANTASASLVTDLTLSAGSPAHGAGTIEPFAFATNISANTSGTSTSVGATWLIDTANTNFGTADGKFAYCFLYDSAGTKWFVLNSLYATKKFVLFGAGSPAAGAYRVQADPSVLTSLGPIISTLGLLPKDLLSYQKAQPNGQLSGQDLEIRGTIDTDATLNAYQVRVKGALRVNLNNNTSISCSTRGYRDIALATAAGLLFDHAHITNASGKRDIVVTEYGTPVIEYLDTEGKTVKEALSELALNGSAYLIGANKYLFIQRDQNKTGGSVKALDALLMTHSTTGLWQKFYNMVKVTGSEDRFSRKGGVTYPQSVLEIVTDYVLSMARLRDIRDRAYAFFGIRRRGKEVEVLDDGTAYQLWDRVSISAAEYWVYRLLYDVRSLYGRNLDRVGMELVKCTGVAASTGETEEGDEAVDTDPPEAPEGVMIVKATENTASAFAWCRDLYPRKDFPKTQIRNYMRDDKSKEAVLMVKRPLYFVLWKWEQDDVKGRLWLFHLTRWAFTKDRDRPEAEYNLTDAPNKQYDGVTGDHPNAAYAGYWCFPMYMRKTQLPWELVTPRWCVDVQAVYRGGTDDTVSAPSEYASTDDANYAVGNIVPAPTVSGVVSVVKDKPGTAMVECDLAMNVLVAPCDQVEVLVTSTLGAATETITQIFTNDTAKQTAAVCEDTDVDSGADTVTFAEDPAWSALQVVRYECSGAGVITGLTNNTLYTIYNPVAGAYQLRAYPAAGVAIPLTAPTGEDQHTFVPWNTKAVYIPSHFPRGATLNPITVRGNFGNVPGTWTTVASKVAGSDSTAIAVPGLPSVLIKAQGRKKIKLLITLNATDTAATKAACSEIRLYTADRWTHPTPAPDDETSTWDRHPTIDIAQQARNGKTKWNVTIWRDEEEPAGASKWRPSIAVEVVNYKGDTSGFTFLSIGLTVDMNVDSIVANGDGTYTCTATCTAANGSAPYHYEWNWGDAASDQDTTATASHTYAATGTYLVSCEVRDSAADQNISTGYFEVTIGNSFARYGSVGPGTAVSVAWYPKMDAGGSTIPAGATKTAWTDASKMLRTYKGTYGAGSVAGGVAYLTKYSGDSNFGSYGTTHDLIDANGKRWLIASNTTSVLNLGASAVAPTDGPFIIVPKMDVGSTDYAECPVTAGGYSESLLVTNLGNALGVQSTYIRGVEVYVSRKAESAGKISDAWVCLVSAATPTQAGYPQVKEATWLTTNETPKYGSSAFIWNASLTPAIVNGSGFGVAFGVYNSGGATWKARVHDIFVITYFETNA
jgi:hypothetical protein